MPVNNQTIKIPVEAEITNVSKTISELRELTKNVRPDTKGFKDINTLLDQAERKLLDVQKRSANGLIDKRALAGIERSFGEAFASVETAANKLQHIDFSGLILSDAQKESLNSIAIAIEKARTEYSKIETSKLDELAKSGKNVVEGFNLAKIDLNTDGIDSSIDKIDNKIEELNKSLNTLQNRKNEKVRLIEIEQGELDKLNKIKQIFTAKEGSGRAAFSDIFTASGDKFKTGGKEALHGMLTALGIDDISIETLKNTSATKIQELWDSIEKKVEEVRREHENRRKRLSSGVKTDEQNIELKTQDIASLTELRGNIEALKVDPDVKEGFVQLTNEIQRLTLENEKLKQEIIDQAGLQSGAAKAIKDTGEAADGAARKIEEASGALDRMNKITNTIGNIKSTIAQWMGFYQVINLSRRAIQSMVQDIRELDKVMTEIAIVTNMTQQDLWNQMNTYQSIAKEYAVSTKGVYEVSQLFYQQGLDSVSVMKLTTETLKMAKIAGLDYSTATDYMTVALRGFHLEMDQAQNVVDVYSNIASKSASSTEELANAMSKTASSAAAVGSSFENTTAMIALMVETTRESSQNIGSALKSIISRYGEMKASPAKLVDSEGEELDFNKVDTALKSVGISLKDAQGQFRDFDEVILELSKKWQTLDVNTQRYIATIMAGNRQQSRFLALVSDYDRLAELTEAAANSQDVATLQTLKTLDSLESKIQNVKTAWQGFYANLGLEAVFKGALEIVTNILNRLNQMPKLFGKIPLSAASIVAQMISMIKSFSTYVINKLAETWTRVAEDYKKKMAQAGQEGGKALADNTDREAKSLSQKWNDFKNNKKRVTGAAGTALSAAGMAGTAYAMSIGDDNAGFRAGVQAASGVATLTGSIFSGFATGGPWGAILGGVTGLIAALPNLTNAINDLKNKELLAIKASEKKVETYKKEALQAKQEANDISNTIEKLKQLEEAKYSSNEAYEEWLNYKTQIADSYPELISYYTLEGEAVLDLSKGYDTLAKKRKEAALAALKEKQEQNNAAQKTAELVNNTLQNLRLLNGALTLDYISNNDWGDDNGSGLRNISVIKPESNGRTRIGFTNMEGYIFNQTQSNLLFSRRPTGKSNYYNYLNTDYNDIKTIRDNGSSELKQVSAALLYEALNQQGIFDLSLFKDVTGVSKTDLEELPELYKGKLEGLADRYLDIFLSYFKMADSMAELGEESAKINLELAQMGADFTSQVEKIINNSELPDKEQYSHLLEDDSFVTLWNNRMLSFAKDKGYENVTTWLEKDSQGYNKQAEEYVRQLYDWYTSIGNEVYTRAISIVSNTQDYTTQDAAKKELEDLRIDISNGFGQALISSLEQTWTEKNEKTQSAFKDAISASTNLNNKDVSSAAIKLEKIADGQAEEISSRYLNNIQTQWYNLVNKASSQYDRGVNATFLADIYSQTSQLEEAANNTVAGILSAADLSSKEGIQAAIDSIETYQSTITDEAQKADLNDILSDLKAHKDQLLININTELAAYSKSIDEALEANEKIHKTQSSGFDKISDMETALKKINTNREEDKKLTFNQAFIWDKNLNSYIYSAEGLQAALDAQLIDTQEQYDKIIESIENIDTAIDGVGYLNLGVSNTDKYSENFNDIITNYIKKLEKEPKDGREEIINARIEVLRRILAIMTNSDISFEEAIKQIKEQNESDKATAESLKAASDQMTKTAELSSASKAFDYSSYLSSGRTATDKEKLETAYNEYNEARINAGEVTLGTFEEVVSILEAGGTAAIDLAQKIAKDRGISLQPKDIEEVYRAAVAPLEDAQAQLEYGIGSLVSGKAIDILKAADYTLDDNGVIIAIGDLNKAYQTYYEKLKDAFGATTAAINAAYAKVLETRDGEQVVIDALGDAANMTYTRLGEILASAGKRLDNEFSNISQYIESVGGNKIRITDFAGFADYMEWDANSEEYWSAFKTYNDAMVDLNRKAERNITEELQKALNAQEGDWVNLTQLTSRIPEELLNRIISGTGAVIKDGILKLDEGASANIAEIVNRILEITSSSGLLLDNEVNELKDAIQNLLNTYINLFKNGISGSLSNVDANKLQNWATTLNPELNLDFSRTYEGLRLSNQSAIELYQALKNVDGLRANLLFNDLADSLQNSNEHYKSMSTTLARIAELNKKINDENVSDARLNQYKQELAVAKEIAAVRLTTDDSGFDFMNNKLPASLQNPVDYIDSIGEMFKSLNTAATTGNGKIDVTDFYNIVNELNNMARVGGNIEFLGHTLDGELTTASELIQEGFHALSNIDGEGTKVDLSKFGIDFASGAEGMGQNIEEGIHAMAESQIKMIDAMIQLLETIVAMEELGDIDVDSNGIFNFDDIFKTEELEDGTKRVVGFTQEWTEAVDALLKSADTNADLDKALKSVEINGHSIKQILSTGYENLKDIELDEQQYAALMTSLVQWAKSGDYDLDNLYASIKEIMAGSSFNGVIKIGDLELSVGYGQVITFDAETKSWLDSNGKSHNTREEAMTANIEKDIANAKEGSTDYDESSDSYTTEIETKVPIKIIAVTSSDGKVAYKIEGSDAEYSSEYEAVKFLYDNYVEEQQAAGSNSIQTFEQYQIQVLGHIVPDIIVSNPEEVKNATQDQINDLAQALVNGDTESVIEAAKKVGINVEVTGELTAEQRNEIAKLAGIESKTIALNLTSNTDSDPILGELLAGKDGIERKISVTVDLAKDNTGLLSGNGEITTDAKASASTANLTAQINSYTEEPEAIIQKKNLLKDIVAYVTSYDNSDATVPKDFLTGIEGIVESYIAAPGAEVDKSKIEKLVATITEFESDGKDPNELVNGLEALIASYSDEGATGKPETIDDIIAYIETINTKGADAAFSAWKAQKEEETVAVNISYKYQGTDLESADYLGQTEGGMDIFSLGSFDMPEGKGSTTKVGVDTKGAEKDVEALQNKIQEEQTTPINGDTRQLKADADEGKRYAESLNPEMEISGDASQAINAAQSAMAEISNMSAQIQIDANVNIQQTTTESDSPRAGGGSGGTTSRVSYLSKATGNVALAGGTRQTLMGELGPELYVANGHYYIAGQHGAEFVDLPDNAIVFNHLQTERLLKNGSAGRGKAVTNEHKATSLATGNTSGPAMASASAALAALKQIRAMWDAMLHAGISDLGSKAGLGKGGGGGGDKDKGQVVKLDAGYIRDLERWYNLLRQIDRLEQDINYEEKLRAKLQADTVANGKAIYESQRKTYDMLQREIDDRVELAGLKKGYYEQRMAEIQAGPWGQLFYFNEEGVPQMKNLDFLANVFASSEEGGAVHNAREQYAMLQQAGFGQLLQYKEDGSIIEWTDDEGKPREEAYKEAVEAFSAKLDAQTEEVNSLREDYIEEMGTILDLQTQQNEILTQIRENTIAVEQEVLKAIEDFREREIDELQNQRDALSNSADKFIDGLTDSLNKEREMYNSQQEDTELLQMRRQLAILQRSGGSASQIRSLQEQIRQREQEAYFEEQENQINAIKEASDLQLERLDAQISLMQETLEYQKAQGLLWDQVHEIMQGTHEEITQFVTGNNSEWWAKSATQTQNDLVELDNKIGQWVAHRDDISTLGETMKNAIANGIAAITSVVSQVSASQQYTVSGTGSYVLPSESSNSGGNGGSSNAGSSKKSSAKKKNTAATNATKQQEHKYIVSYIPLGSNSMVTVSYSSLSAAQEAVQRFNKLGFRSVSMVQQYKEGGLIDYTGPAWVDGSKKKPEGILNAEQLDMLRNSVLTRRNPVAALLADYGNTVSNTANASTYNSIDRSGDTIIENAQVVMNVSKLSNDYDAKQAGKTALEEMLRISRKTKPTSVSRR